MYCELKMNNIRKHHIGPVYHFWFESTCTDDIIIVLFVFSFQITKKPEMRLRKRRQTQLGCRRKSKKVSFSVGYLKYDE